MQSIFIVTLLTLIGLGGGGEDSAPPLRFCFNNFFSIPSMHTKFCDF